MKENMMNKIYEIQQEELDKMIKEEGLKLKEKNKDIIDPEEKENIKMSSFIEIAYKKGFFDGVNLILNCMEK